VKLIASNEQPRDRSSWLFALRCWLFAAVCPLLVGLSGCGPGGSGNAPSLEARASGGKASTVSSSSDNGAGSASGKETVPAENKPPSKSAGTPDITETVEDKIIKSIESKNSTPLPIPDSITKALDSSDARARLKALDYWATQGTKAPLDPLLEALEDEDKDVRTKAAKIVEQHLGIKQELD
jgi:hypothetical protein